MAMTPETVRLITDMMANMGTAIGGPGSAGELIGGGVKEINRAERAREERMKEWEVKKSREAAAGSEYLRRLEGESGVSANAEDYLDTEYGKDSTFTQALSQFADVVSPADQLGPTSIKAGKEPGTISMDFTTLLSPEQQASLEMRKQSRAAQETPETKAAKSRKILDEAIMAEVIEGPGGSKITRAQKGKHELAKSMPTTGSKQFDDFLSRSPAVQEQWKEFKKSGAIQVTTGSKVETRGALAAEDLRNQARTTKYMADLRENVYDSPDNAMLVSESQFGKTSESRAKATETLQQKLGEDLRDSLKKAYGKKLGTIMMSGVEWYAYQDESNETILIQKVIK